MSPDQSKSIPESGRHHRRARSLPHAALALLLLALLVWPERRRNGDGPATIYFFSSESSINNFNMLKGEFDWFFSSAGRHKFQPFRNRSDFDNVLEQQRPGLFLMSSWHYAQLEGKEHWRPVLIGSRGRSSRQRHVLTARDGVRRLGELRGKTIAAAGSDEFARQLLRQMLPPDDRDSLAQFQILTVPKDIDALMSVGFGAAAAAITTEHGLERMAKLNPGQHAQLLRVATGPDQLLPVIVAPADSNKACAELVEVMLKMGSDPDGQQLLRMLGLDAWQTIAPEELEVLQK
jgi:ABC-type phosphate/phosphonate transport system substrate-binding protein